VKNVAQTTALVLSGGGAYGAFAVGIMKALFAGASPVTKYRPLEVGIFSGTSVGAFNSACMVGCVELALLDASMRLERIWLERIASRPGRCGQGAFRIRGNPVDYLDANCLRQPIEWAERVAQDTLAAGRYFIWRGANFLASPASLLDRTAAALNFGSLVDATPFQTLVRDTFLEEDVRRSSKRLHVAATNWSTGNAEYFSNEDFAGGRGYQAVMASAASPGILPPVTIGESTYVDGGVLDNTPLRTALKAGASELHVVYLDPAPILIPLPGEASTIDTLLRVYYLMLASKIKNDIETAGRINDGLRALREFEAVGNVPTNAALAFAKVASKLLQRNYHISNIHRYFPKYALGGDFGMLDFAIETIARIIREGENVAMTHDCGESGCLLNE